MEDLTYSRAARIIAWSTAALILASMVPTAWKLSAATWLIERTHRGCEDCDEKAEALRAKAYYGGPDGSNGSPPEVVE